MGRWNGGYLRIERASIFAMIYPINLHQHGQSREGISIQNFDYWETTEIPEGFFSAGIHPWFTPTESQWQAIQQAWNNPRCLALGECGLDRLRGPSIEEQQKWLCFQLERTDLPVIVHAVRVDSDLLKVIRQYASKKWVIHGVIGKWERWKKFADAGVHLSFGKGLLTDGSTRETFRNCPKSQIFLETDAAAPEIIHHLYALAAELQQKEMNVLKREIWSNFVATFDRYGT